MVAGQVPVGAVLHLAPAVGEAVPVGGAGAVGQGMALDLVGGGGRAPQEVREAAARAAVRSWSAGLYPKAGEGGKKRMRCGRSARGIRLPAEKDPDEQAAGENRDQGEGQAHADELEESRFVAVFFQNAHGHDVGRGPDRGDVAAHAGPQQQPDVQGVGLDRRALGQQPDHGEHGHQVRDVVDEGAEGHRHPHDQEEDDQRPASGDLLHPGGDVVQQPHGGQALHQHEDTDQEQARLPVQGLQEGLQVPAAGVSQVPEKTDQAEQAAEQAGQDFQVVLQGGGQDQRDHQESDEQRRDDRAVGVPFQGRHPPVVLPEEE